MTTNPYLQGMDAARNGKLPKDNPYTRGRTDWTRWLGGYRAVNPTVQKPQGLTQAASVSLKERK